jgi:hypothetical protein
MKVAAEDLLISVHVPVTIRLTGYLREVISIGDIDVRIIDCNFVRGCPRK